MYITGEQLLGRKPLSCDCGHEVTDDELSFRRIGPRYFEYVCPDCGEVYTLEPVADPN